MRGRTRFASLRLNPAALPTMAASGGLAYFLSSEVGLQVKLQVQQLHGSVPAMSAAEPPLSYSAWLAEACGVAPNDLNVTAQLLVRRPRARQPTWIRAPRRARWRPAARLGFLTVCLSDPRSAGGPTRAHLLSGGL